MHAQTKECRSNFRAPAGDSDRFQKCSCTVLFDANKWTCYDVVLPPRFLYQVTQVNSALASLQGHYRVSAMAGIQAGMSLLSGGMTVRNNQVVRVGLVEIEERHDIRTNWQHYTLQQTAGRPIR